MTSEIDKLKHFHVENYSGTNFTDDLNDGEEFLYTTIRCKDDKEVTLLCKHAIKELKLAGYGNGAFTKRATSRYSFATKECSCLKGIRLEDVTVELEKEAYEEIY